MLFCFFVHGLWHIRQGYLKFITRTGKTPLWEFIWVSKMFGGTVFWIGRASKFSPLLSLSESLSVTQSKSESFSVHDVVVFEEKSEEKLSSASFGRGCGLHLKQ